MFQDGVEVIAADSHRGSGAALILANSTDT
jgi:hypothetical protein